VTKSYVLGFCFNARLDQVVLIEKTRPQWQAGRLNGVGGHIENGETPPDAMAREFREEADWADPLDWRCFGCLHGGDWEVFLFYALNIVVPSPFNESPEGTVSAHHVCCVLGQETSKGARPLPNLRYLIPMAINHSTGEDRADFFDIRECTPLPMKSKPHTERTP
jgi:8-oxo-dGTP diphosphatase